MKNKNTQEQINQYFQSIKNGERPTHNLEGNEIDWEEYGDYLNERGCIVENVRIYYGIENINEVIEDLALNKHNGGPESDGSYWFENEDIANQFLDDVDEFLKDKDVEWNKEDINISDVRSNLPEEHPCYLDQ